MAEISLKINGTLVDVDEFTASVLGDIITTQNPGSKTVVDAVNNAGGESYVEIFSSKPMDDVFEVTVNGTTNGRKYIKTGKGTRSVIVERFRLALSAAKWQIEVTTVYDGETSATKKDSTVRKMAAV
jgi:hypothetical protein